jgi:hypothetical protein
MATTTNYGWATPDDTALVKDGAAAIRTLGSSVDTTTKALNPSTTLGDIEYRSATANTNTRLALGTAGQVLTVNSGANAPEWATPASGGMTLLSTTTLTGSEVSITSIPSTYNNLQLVIRSFRPVIDGFGAALRVNSDSGSVYFSQISSTAAGVASPALTHALSSNNQDAGAASNSLIVCDLFDYANSSTWKVTTTMSTINNAATPTDAEPRLIYGMIFLTSAISSIQIRCQNGDMTSGTALLYGVK